MVTLVFLTAGCLSPIPLSKQTIPLNQPYVVQTSDYSFTAYVSQIHVQENGTVVKLDLTVQNTGNQGTTLASLPELIDPAGEEYEGTELFYSRFTGGHALTETDTIYLPPGTYDTLKQNAILHVRFQGADPLPFDAYWAIDFTKLPQ
ncbi:hypothetical protein [Methanoregula sp.]|uniref:hypothetical protein n=1 Tax=Methanoregula sp. TaxID=2052170 RepID=UPI002D800A23|nr:hypothetical protein [Methanoregula sp.]